VRGQPGIHLQTCGFLLEDTDGSRSRMPILGVWGMTPGLTPVIYVSRDSNSTVNATYIDWKIG